MEKYMGNKSKLLDFIYENINEERASSENTIFDAFAGTTNVGKYFKQKGYNVICNDINDLTYVLSNCYITNNTMPKFEQLINSECVSAINMRKMFKTNSFCERKLKLLSENKNILNDSFKTLIGDTRYLNVLVYLTYYATPGDYDNSIDNGMKKVDMYDFLQRNYTEKGNNSKYINLVYKRTLDNVLKKTKNCDARDLINTFYKEKNLKYLIEANKVLRKYDPINHEKVDKILSKNNVVGNRKFFSFEHAQRLDIIINTISYWVNNNFISQIEFYILMASVLESIAIFSNTSATYQAFYKEYKANTLQAFRLVVPELILGYNKYTSIRGDIFENINKTTYDILYLDPPYNWRQYDSNYHLLNTIAKINEIPNIGEFEKNIVGASGENRVEKLEYTSFNKTETFEKRMSDLIKKSNCSLVAISYSDSSSNHRVNNIDETLNHIEEYLNDTNIFVEGSYKKIEFSRQNFESRKSNQKQLINEILYIARKK